MLFIGKTQKKHPEIFPTYSTRPAPSIPRTEGTNPSWKPCCVKSWPMSSVRHSASRGAVVNFNGFRHSWITVPNA